VTKPKVALVHDWLTGEAGAEQVLLALHRLFPEAPIYTSVRNPERTPSFEGMDIRTSFLQKWPLWKRQQLYPQLRPLAFESFDLSDYDVVISIASAESKGVVTRPGTVHICYCNTPIRYYWNDYHAYLGRMEFGLLNPLVRLVMPYLTNYLRLWDYTAAQRVDYFVANSKTTQARIGKYYRRDSQVIYPPVAVDSFKYQTKKDDYFLCVGRLVPYKRVDLAVQACTEQKLTLKVAGEGPELDKLKKLAGPTIEFLGRVPSSELPALYAKARAFIFAAEEDFGIVPVEAMASGTPVITYGLGGATETVVDGVTGLYFGEQTVESLIEALKKFDKQKFEPKLIRARAEEFNESRFAKELSELVARVKT
jgi:glycosyltransferase involved in cell wall biosynthesis